MPKRSPITYIVKDFRFLRLLVTAPTIRKLEPAFTYSAEGVATLASLIGFVSHRPPVTFAPPHQVRDHPVRHVWWQILS